MNYIELEIGGEKRGAKLGLGFLEKVQTKLNMNLQEISDKAQKEAFTFIPTILYHSLAFNCERAKKEQDFDLYDVLDWCTDMGAFKEGSELLKFWNAFNESIIKQVPDQVEKTEEKAKKK